MRCPNIVIILIDDMGWRDLSCYGSTFYETPHIDRLAEEGMLFTQAYASCPVCSPSRASLLTGKYPARLGLTNFIGGTAQGKLLDVPFIDHLPKEEYTLPHALKLAGYKTWHVGKWHLGEKEFYPEQHGFDINIGGCHWGRPVQGYFSPWGIETLADGPEGEYLTDRLTNEAISLIANNDSTPFFLHLSHYAVHTPIEAKAEDIQRFEEKAKHLRLHEVEPFVQGEHFSCDHKREQKMSRRIVQSDIAYAALIYNLDQNIGKLMDALKQKNIYNDTVIFFTSDNGGLSSAEGAPTCNAPLAEGKGWMYDGGVREPLIIRGAGVQPNSKCHVPTIATDFFPTILELAGLPLMTQQHKDGVSILSLMHGEQQLDRDAIFWHYPHYSNQGGCPGAAIRCNQYKLIKFFEDNHVELYDLSQDISESFNLSEQMPSVAAKLEERLMQWLCEMDAKIPQKNPAYIADDNLTAQTPPELLSKLL